MPAFTVLHTADWHLGVRLRELDRVEEHTAFLAWLTEAVEREDADLLVIAGDVFDSANPPESARRMWYEFLDGLHRRCPQCAVVAVAGNHDSPYVLESAASLLSGIGVHIIGEWREDPAHCLRIFPDKSGVPALAVAAVPFLRDRDLRAGGDNSTATDIQSQLRDGIRGRYAAMEGLAKTWKTQGCAVLATGHLTVIGGKPSDSERDIHVGNLGSVSADTFGGAFDYVALGHLHRPQQAGGGAVRYSGSPIALSFSEWRDEKEIGVLKFENGALTDFRSLPIPCTRPLLRLATSAETLEPDLASLVPAETLHPAWLEITVGASAEPVAVLSERIQKALAGRRMEIIAVRRSLADPGAVTETAATIHELHPAEVFEAVLQDSAIPEQEREPLRVVFTQLLERHHEEKGVES
jgi:DNA repair protein SbcD/Mre11